MDPMRWAIRLYLWLRHPPSPQRVMLWIAVIALCVIVVLYERIYGWPSWATVDPLPRVPRPRL